MQAAEYRDLVGAYVEKQFASRGLVVYSEVSLGKTIIGKNRRVDLFVLRKEDQRALALECKYQRVSGTTDEKIPYALQDLESMWVPGCLAYAGDGWSQGVLHTLEGTRLAVYCLPELPGLARSNATMELDHVLASVFGLWDVVIPEGRLFAASAQLDLPLKGLRKAIPRSPPVDRAAGDDDS